MKDENFPKQHSTLALMHTKLKLVEITIDTKWKLLYSWKKCGFNGSRVHIEQIYNTNTCYSCRYLFALVLRFGCF